MSAFEFEGHEALIAQLRGGTLDAPDHLRRRVLAGAPARRRRIAAMSARQRFFIALPVAASIAVVAAVVNGVFFSSSSQSTPFNAAALRANPRASSGVVHGLGPMRTSGAKGATGANGATGAAGATGLAGPTGMKGPASAAGPEGAPGPTVEFGAALTSNSPQNDHRAAATQGALIIPTGRLTHADANLQVVVPDSCGALTTATNKASAIVTHLGGYSQSVQYRASQKCAGSAYLVLHVPLGKTEAAITQLGGLGKLVSQSVSTQDLQQQYTKQTSQIGQLQRKIAVWEQELQSGTLSPGQRAETQFKLTQAKRALAGTRKARIHTVKAGTNADIQLLLTTKRDAAAIVRPHKTGRLGQMLHNMVVFLGVEAIAVLYALLVAGPILLVGGLIWWFTAGRRRRDERQLLAQGA